MPNHLDFVTSCGLEDKSVLEVGCGPMGVVYFVPGAVRVGIDPLAREYVSSLNFATRGVHLLAGVGESLPFATATFDVVIIGNVLDHVARPDETLAEIRRVLRPGGVLVLWMHVIPLFLLPVRPLLNVVDGGHPHHLTEHEAYGLLRRAGLEPVGGRTQATGLGSCWGWKGFAANVAMRTLVCRARLANEPETVAAS